MAETGYKQALAEVVAKARAEELQLRTEEDQLDLFGAVAVAVQAGQVPVANGENGQRRMGRPPGARNRRTDEAARFYMSRAGDPLSRAIEIAAIPILGDGVLAEFAKLIGAPNTENGCFHGVSRPGSASARAHAPDGRAKRAPNPLD